MFSTTQSFARFLPALANKNARIVWALLTKETDFLPEGKPA
jgi:hypothetical protein